MEDMLDKIYDFLDDSEERGIDIGYKLDVMITQRHNELVAAYNHEVKQYNTSLKK